MVYSGDKLDIGKYYVTFASDVNTEQSGKLKFHDNQGIEIDAGDWYFEQKEGGVVWLIFDITGDLSNHSDITLTADVTCEFGYTDQPIEFDGDITVKVDHNEDSPDTKVYKWAKDLDPDNPNQIQWRSEIYGNSGSHIIGSTVTDKITTPDTHSFTKADMEAGIEFEATKYKTESSFDNKDNILESHSWTVKPGDAGFTWDATHWTYTMPAQIKCADCGQTITLGNDDWLYYMRYTSTIKEGMEGYTLYENEITCDGKTATGRTHTGVTESNAGVVKIGRYVQPPDPDLAADGNPYMNDTFEWTLTVKIPAARQDQKFDYFWYLWDTLRVKEEDTTHHNNPLQDITVTAAIGDAEPITIPKYNTPEAENAQICWNDEWTSDDGYGQQIDFYTKCNCTEANCPTWTGSDCGDKKDHQGFCRCWSYAEDVTITVTYSTPAGDLSETYGGRGAELVNSVDLNNKQWDGTKFTSAKIDDASANVPIPGVFTKKLTGKPEDNGLIAAYTITVNEAMADFGSLQELTITDTMTPTLSLLPSSLKIQCEGADRTFELPADQYTVSGVQEVETAEGKRKIFNITLHKEALGPYKYTLTYNASVSGNNDVGLKYQNTASITLFGKEYTGKSTSFDVPSAAIGAKTYAATLLKRDADKTNRLGLNGAVFALYTYVDGKKDIPMYDYETGIHKDANGIENPGIAQVETLPEEGVILHAHTLYYVKETKAPNGYKLDSTPHYFWFCDDGENCELTAKYEPFNATCIYSGADPDRVDLVITNEPLLQGHELPETGGYGTTPYTVGGALLLTGAGLLLLYKKRRKEDFASS